MANIWRIFLADLKHLRTNVMTIIIAIGLVIVPSLFAWYNIIACWNVFDNTGNLTVAVANTDEGYQSDLIPLRVNVGEQVVAALRANDQIDWRITDEADAVDGAKSGRYYAAVVIPQNFSRDMLTFYTGDSGHADIIYCANEKKSAIAPKITDQGADSVSYQVNAAFAQTLSEVSLTLAESISSFADSDDWDGRIAVVADHVREMADAFDDAAGVLVLYSSLAQSCQDLSTSSADLAQKASGTLDETLAAASVRADAVPATVDTLRSSAASLDEALTKSTSSFSAVAGAVDELFDAASDDAEGIAGDLRSQADALSKQAGLYRQVAGTLEGLASSLPETVRPQVNALASRVRSVASQADSMASSLTSAADKLASGETDVAAEREEAKAKAAEAVASITAIRDDYEANVAPGLSSLADEAAAMAGSLGQVTEDLKGVGADLSASAGSAAEVMGNTAEKITETTDKLHEVSAGLRDMAKSIDEALASGDRDALKAVLGADVSVLSKALAMPVGVERTAVFPVENFGSAMAPLYTTLALFIGSLLILVVFKPKLSRAMQREAGVVNVKPRQLFFGHFGVMAAISLAQTTVMGLGNMLFVQVQVENPILYMLCCWWAGLVFTFIIYALVVSFANLGKAIAVILLIVQVTGCGGSYPLQILPDFVQALSPWLPATHVVNAMRGAMMGVYANDFWVQMGMLALFLVPAALLGLVLRKPLEKFMEWYVEQVETSQLIS